MTKQEYLILSGMLDELRNKIHQFFDQQEEFIKSLTLDTDDKTRINRPTTND
jgi:hypothetical protein